MRLFVAHSNLSHSLVFFFKNAVMSLRKESSEVEAMLATVAVEMRRQLLKLLEHTVLWVGINHGSANIEAILFVVHLEQIRDRTLFMRRMCAQT